MGAREESGLFRVRCVLRITQPTRLHAMNDPLLYATLAEAWAAARHGPPAVPDGVLRDAPEQCRIEWERDARYACGFTILAPDGAAATERLDLLVAGLRPWGRKATKRRRALGGNFEIAASRTWSPPGRTGPASRWRRSCWR